MELEPKCPSSGHSHLCTKQGRVIPCFLSWDVAWRGGCGWVVTDSLATYCPTTNSKCLVPHLIMSRGWTFCLTTNFPFVELSTLAFRLLLSPAGVVLVVQQDGFHSSHRPDNNTALLSVSENGMGCFWWGALVDTLPCWFHVFYMLPLFGPGRGSEIEVCPQWLTRLLWMVVRTVVNGALQVREGGHVP